ncbi:MULTISPECIES: Fe(3+) dicitrate ABC transporter substrate-binding protein [unclassified Staphylococcus]|uniref:ABC transporter substrate-binding protein n=1 Tax=unclassified Staphylococcus TaxID=91994 RepID=UPI0021D2B3AD|nr:MULTISPECIES: Fe(3+) dicitrate ABC transporter substrate-binding protein [unclassified Staphylococcus]UXR69200.1 Fe(3+) dicitrate ABC transporter substrate-binding protein [Staphylococcus sp. IVB6246]UXR71255.1 Fe(3+) dicitrate ABC transporter substrate-binding protein [Staphylococcus sp. IVB6240]UXR73530.1 Fe(3+) dicitrate ABC transporter substrate-binding protein [Staphylococcus sp. IVB6238]UXR75847.1 Fe(3+) dicitrate ABC transporter substrate-binding protein [Staphylococcus sp. IVB6233]U
MNKNKWIGLIAMIAVMLLVAACGNANDSKKDSESSSKGNAVEVKHDGGTTKIEKEPKKVVALEYSFVDALVALGVKPVGIADDGDKENIIDPIRDKVGDYKSVGDRKQPNLEVISQLKPDLIIADSNRHKGNYEQLSKIAPTILLPSLDSDYKQNLEAFKTIGKALSKEDAADKRLKEHKEKIEKYQKDISMDKDKKVLPAVISQSGLLAHSDKSYVGQFLHELGFKEALTKDVADQLPEYLNAPYLNMNSEQLSDVNPERMFIMVNGEDDPFYVKMKEDKVWNELDAVKNDRVHVVDRLTWAKFRGLISSEEIAKELAEISKSEK